MEKSKMNRFELIEKKYGLVRKISGSSFVWEIRDFINILEQESYNIVSPYFQFEGDSWKLWVCRGKIKYKLTSFGLCWNPRGDNKRLEAYRLSIKDFKSNDYWTSGILVESFNNLGKNTVQGLIGSHLKRDLKKIAPAGILSLHVMFFSREGVPREEDCGPSEEDEHHSTCSTTEAGASSHSLCNEGLSSSCGLDKLMRNMKDLLLSEKYCDVTLNVKGKRLRAHKPILSARSPVFAIMFQHEMLEKKSGIVDIDDCDPDGFHDFLLYLYTGKLEKLDGKSVIFLHYIAHKYDVEDLAAICVQFMIDTMTVDFFCDFVTVGLQHCDLALIKFANKFFGENLEQIFCTEKWKAFFLEHSTEAYELLRKALVKKELLPISEQ